MLLYVRSSQRERRSPWFIFKRTYLAAVWHDINADTIGYERLKEGVSEGTCAGKHPYEWQKPTGTPEIDALLNTKRSIGIQRGRSPCRLQRSDVHRGSDNVHRLNTEERAFGASWGNCIWSYVSPTNDTLRIFASRPTIITVLWHTFSFQEHERSLSITRLLTGPSISEVRFQKRKKPSVGVDLTLL